MNVKFLNPFVEAAVEVLEAEVGVTAQRGDLSLQRSAYTANDLTVLINLVGQTAPASPVRQQNEAPPAPGVQGVVFYGMSEATAMSVVSRILDQPFEELDDLAQSGVGELGNVITGQASKHLSEAGYEARISPPSLILGKGTLVSTLDFQRLVVPLNTDLGEIQIHLALREVRNNGHQSETEGSLAVGEGA